jgi:chromatin segregation and condensation protein Rec8/ScpA/Scc1 (kleisin family)
LENLKDNGEYEKFFTTLEELDQDVRSQYFQSSTAEFKTFLEKHKGASVAEDYNKLQQRVQMEKYNPVKSADALEELLKTIVNLYSQISK